MNSDQNQNQERATTTQESVRSRWTPKPEQIQILETLFNSGTVNPAKDETVKIRKILEKYGSVGDTNVFYWFQNRRSRSRRRQRQLQAAATAVATAVGDCSGSSNSSSASVSTGASGIYTSFGDDLSTISQQMSGGSSFPFMMDSYHASSHDQSGTTSVFINGIPSEVPRGLFDLRAMFGQDVVLANSSGEILPFSECGILLQSVQMGENYFLVSRPT